MSCVDVPVPSSPLVHRSTQLLEPGQHGVRIQGGSRPPAGLDPLAGEYSPGRINNASRQQVGYQGRGRGGGAGRGGLSSAMNRAGQQGNQQQSTPARQLSSDALPSSVAAASSTTTESSNGGGAAGGDNGGGGSGTGGGANTSGGVGRSGSTASIGGGGSRGGAVANANHLLNFQYEPAAARAASGRGSGRGAPRPGGSARGAGGGGGGGFGPASASRGRHSAAKPQKYDKNKFLQANFRFLVSDAVDVSAYEADADKMFDWDDVLQVEMAIGAPVQCPISLDSPPLCPQITPCGHVFSFPAIMHHLMNHGGEQLRRSAPCPLCFAPVVARELRLVRVRRVVQPRAGDQLTLALIRRTRTSIIPQPVDPAAAAIAATAAPAAGGGGSDGGGGGGGSGSAASDPVSLFDSNPFAKFVVGGDASELWREAAEQLAACATELVAEGGVDAALEAPYVYGALEQLAARARRWAEHRAECLAARGLLAAREGPEAVPEALGAAAEAAVKKMFTAAVSDVTATREAASKRAALDHQFPSLSARPSAASAAPSQPPAAVTGTSGAARESPVTSPLAKSRSSSSSGGGGGGSAVAAGANPAGNIAAAAPPRPATAATEATAEPPSNTPADSQLPFDAVFSEDEAEEELQEGGGSGGAAFQPPPAPPSGSSLDGTGPPDLLAAASAPVGSCPPSSAAAAAAAAAKLAGGGGGGGGAAPPGGGAEVLGTSPSTRLNLPGTQGEFYTYQAADGSWVFLHPLNLRCLLHVYGSYDSCPPVITARLLELEDVVQADVTRRRWRFLSHLPLSGAFKLCEVAMTDLVPPEALVPFADELSAREKRRRRQRADERRQAAAEAAAAARAAASRQGPSAEELQAMPSLSQALGGGNGGGGGGASVAASGGGGLVAAAGAAAAALAREMQLSPSEVAESIALQASLEDAVAAATSPGPPGGSGGGGVSFAHITKMGFAATGPALGSSPPRVGIAAAAAAVGGPSGAWGARTPAGTANGSSGTASGGGSLWAGGAAAVSAGPGGPWGAGKGGATIKAAAALAAAAPSSSTGRSAATAEPGSEVAAGGGSAKKGKSGKGTLLFSTANQRKY